MRNKTLIIILLLLVLVSSVASSLDFRQIDNIDIYNKVTKDKIDAATKSVLKTEKDPVSYDLKIRPIKVNFNIEKTTYLIIDPVFSSYYGLRDERLKSNIAEENFNKEQRREIAQGVFARIRAVEQELEYFGEVPLEENIYRSIWIRKYENEIVQNNIFYVDVDAGNGNIIGWELEFFEYQIGHFAKVKNPTFGTKNAERLLKEQTDFVQVGKPILVYYNDRNVYWFTNKDGNVVLLDAKTGKIYYTGKLRLYVPKDYTYGNNIVTKYETVSSSTIKQAILALVIVLAIIIIFVVIRKRSKRSNKKSNVETNKK